MGVILVKKKIIAAFMTIMMLPTIVYAQSVTYIVQPGDSIWRIAVKYQAGVSEIIAANPGIKNPNLIYPGQKIYVPSINSDIKSMESEVARLVNVQRANAGLAPLKLNWEMSRVARIKSQDMINKNYFSHISPTYGSPFSMMEDYGIRFSAAGENIAMGQRTPQEVMNAWMNSSGHRANILNPSYNQIGVGLAKTSSGVCYWTQEFIKSLY